MVNLEAPSAPPASYRAPGWPSLAWAIGPQSALATEPVLWYQQDMLLFTLLWTVVVFFVVFTAVGLVAFAMFHRHRAGVFLLVGFSAWGVITGAASGAIVGALLSSFYLTGPLSMPTWVPLAWAIMQVFVAIIFSYSELAFSAL